ncbi:NHLP bacteriocin export ABC transporter permease/ATPase subunit [Acanthopleuribacter pedis]|uniref:NHLP bacteriocin export ABC transporter permease/ATPase subunit n=1 Tax=Acanthopleuribacter pedis TaxID=442870 RepID=A0A8J7U7P9_9BACT|nr:NHLP bacteriocin export ABC transporter permease/ATPase subunit [Acanthopleuribacter pedis]MBO1323234.1 NHLP bacteriocin export ABC transporter permease/ATPase subunit [Acanthopleuribacter pedis]
MSAFFSHLESFAEVVSAAGNERVDLGDADNVWFVKSGKLDVFFGFPEPDHRAPRPNHFLRMEAGSLIFGLEPAASGPNPLLTGVGTNGGSLIKLSRRQLTQMSAEPDWAGEIARRLDDWLTAVANALFSEPTPKNHHQLGGEQQQNFAADDVVVCADAPRWVRFPKGSARPFNHDGVDAVDGSRFFPLSGGAWLQTDCESEAEILATERLLAEPDWEQHLDRYHDNVLAWLHRNYRAKREAEHRRWNQKALNEERMVDATWARFSGVTGADAAQVVPAEVRGDGMLAVCALVTDAANIKLNTEAFAGMKGSPTLAQVSRRSGFRYRQVVLAGEWWREENGPLLGIDAESKRPIALLPRRGARYDAVDPVSGRRWRVSDKNIATISPTAFMFYRPLPARALNFFDLVAHVRFGILGEWVTLLAMAVAIALLGLTVPMGIGMVFDIIIPQSQPISLVVVAAGLVIAGLAKAAMSLVRGLALLRLEGKIGPSLQAAVWDRILSLPVPFFRDYSSGDLIKRAMGFMQIQRSLSGPAITTLINGVFSVFYLAQLFLISPRLGWVALGLVVLALVPLTLSLVKVRLERDANQIEGRLTGLLLQLIGGVSKLRVSGSEARAFSAWAESFVALRRLTYRSGLIEALVRTWNGINMQLSTIVLFIFMMMLQEDQAGLSVGAFIAFSAAFSLFLGAALQLSDTAVMMFSLLPVYERTKPILEAIPETADEGLVEPGELSGSIEVGHLTFRYQPEGRAILDDLSFTIKPNEFVALVGPSGSGKSTLLRMLLGFEKPESGAVYYDGKELAGLDLQEVRRQIGIVLQTSQLVPGSIYHNIIGSLPLSEKDAWEAAAMAGIDQDIRDMPMGMHTEVSEGGGTLSGGQVQRLMIARALANKPRVLFFDEATSALDNKTQAIVTASLDRLKVTRVVIAHRLSTIVNADRIFVLKDGSLVESGNYEALMAQGGIFHKLARRQIT